MDVDAVIAQLVQQGERRATARREAAAAMAEIRQLARTAHEAGAHKATIAAAAQISRPALDELLRG